MLRGRYCCWQLVVVGEVLERVRRGEKKARRGEEEERLRRWGASCCCRSEGKTSWTEQSDLMKYVLLGLLVVLNWKKRWTRTERWRLLSLRNWQGAAAASLENLALRRGREIHE